MEWCFLIIAGALGALVKDIVKDNKLVLPRFENNEVFLGCLGGVIIGASVGYLVDQNPATAFFAGYAGSQMLQSLVPGLRSKK
jgi:hypothetical protein